MQYNLEHNIVPRSVSRPVQPSLVKREDKLNALASKPKSELKKIIEELTVEMLAAADRLDFEKAALLRDQIKMLRKK